VTRVARTLALHELLERTRDRWVLVTAALFALLSVGVTLYGRGTDAAAVTPPSLVTLAAFLVPLVALVLGHDAIVGERERHTLGLLLSLPVKRWEVLVAKYVGRAVAMVLAVGGGLGVCAALLDAGGRAAVFHILGPTMLLGLSFLSVGTLLSVVTWRQATATSLAVLVWFTTVLFWDLGLLALMVATDGAVSQETVLWLVVANPAGLYRTGLLADLSGIDALEEMGLAVALPGKLVQGLVWAAWICGPLLLGTWLLGRPKAVSS
jgi:Cu-processing system permease protein